MVVTQLRVLTFHHLLARATTTKQDSRHFSVKSLGGEEEGGGGAWFSGLLIAKMVLI